MLTVLQVNYKEAWRLKEMELRKKFMGVMVYSVWKRKLKRWGAFPGDVSPIH